MQKKQQAHIWLFQQDTGSAIWGCHLGVWCWSKDIPWPIKPWSHTLEKALYNKSKKSNILKISSQSALQPTLISDLPLMVLFQPYVYALPFQPTIHFIELPAVHSPASLSISWLVQHFLAASVTWQYQTDTSESFYCWNPFIPLHVAHMNSLFQIWSSNLTFSMKPSWLSFRNTCPSSLICSNLMYFYYCVCLNIL